MLSYRRLSSYNATAGGSYDSTRRPFRNALPVLQHYIRTVPSATSGGAAVQTLHRQYEYTGATIDASGRGFQGFQQVMTIAEQEGQKITETYAGRYPFAGRVQKRTVRDFTSDALIHETTNDWRTLPGTANRSFGVQVASSVRSEVFGTQSAKTLTTTTDIAYDSLGNPVLVSENDGDRTRQTCTLYRNDTAQKRPGPAYRVTQGEGCSVSGDSCSCSTAFTVVESEHDSNHNITARKEYDDTRDAWLTTTYAYDSYGNRTQTTLPQGGVETIQYESTYNTYPATITSSGDGKSFVQSLSFDARHGTPARIVDENGVATEYEYDAFGRDISVSKTAPGGQLTQLQSHSYSRDGDLLANGLYLQTSQIAQTWDRSSLVARKTYTDGLGRESRQETGSGSERNIGRRVYDPNGQMVRRSNPHRASETPLWTDYEFNNQRRPVRVSQPSGAVTTLTHGSGGGCAAHEVAVTTVTTGTGGGAGRHAVRCENARGKVTRVVMQDPTTNATTTQTFTLDALDRVTAVADGQSSTTIQLDSLGRKTQVISSDRGTTTFVYNAQGLLVTQSQNGEDQSFEYDGLARETRRTFHDGSSVELSYDDPAFAGSQGRLTRAIARSSDGSETSRREFSYAADGEPAVATLVMDGGSGGTHVMGYQNDPLGRPQSIQYPGGRVACYAYNAQGFLADIKVAAGDCADSQAQSFAAYSDHTALGQPARVVYGNGVASDFTYDDVGRIKFFKTLDSDGAALIDQQYSWTALGEVDAIDDLAGTDDVDYSYSGFGYLTRAVGPYGDLRYEYNPAGNLTNKAGSIITYAGSRPTIARSMNVLDGGLIQTEERTFAYDAHGNVTRRQDGVGGGGDSFDYVYDGRYQIKQIAKNGTQAGLYEYDASGQRVKKIDGNGNETVYVSPELEISRFTDGRVLTTEYIQGPAGRIAAISNETNPTALLHGSPASHALQAQMHTTGSVSGVAGFLNHTTMAYVRTPSVAATARALLWALAVTAVIMASLVYALRAARRRGLIKRILTGLAAAKALDAYPALQSRLQHLATAPLSPAERRENVYNYNRRQFLRAPATLLAITMLSLSMNCGSNAGTAKFAIAPPGSEMFAFNFLLGPGGNGYGYPEAGTFYFQYNQVGSTSLVTDDAGKQAAYTVYKPFGEVYQDASDGRDIFRGKFNNNEYDRDGEVYYFNARYYDPALGSFLQPDTLAFGTNDYHPAALNRYAFSGNNPVTYSDPGGNLFWIPLLIIGGLIGGAVSAISYTVLALIDGSFNWKDFGINLGIGILGGVLGAGISGGLTIALTHAAARATLSIVRQGLQFAATYLAPMLGSSIEAFFGATVIQQLEKGTIDWGQVVTETLVGGAGGLIGIRKYGRASLPSRATLPDGRVGQVVDGQHFSPSRMRGDFREVASQVDAKSGWTVSTLVPGPGRGSINRAFGRVGFQFREDSVGSVYNLTFGNSVYETLLTSGWTAALEGAGEDLRKRLFGEP